jgi:3-dehydroquinate synthase
MPEFHVNVAPRAYSVIVERGVLERAAEFLPKKCGKIFLVTTADVWNHQGHALERALAAVCYERLDLPGGENHKRLAPVEALAEQMVTHGADRSSVILAFGGGIVNDMAGFLAAIFMRGIPVIQIPTTLLAQVDAAVGGKTGVNLVVGKNLLGAFHQPLAVLIDPAALDTLPEREYRAGIYEVIKCGVIRDAALFRFLAEQHKAVLLRDPEAVVRMIVDSVRVKAEVVAADERESDLRRVLNFGHTFGHALEAETNYTRFLHGEAVAFGMKAAVHLAQRTGHLSAEDSVDILETVAEYGPIPSLGGISSENLLGRLTHDKKTVRGEVHFVLPVRIGEAAMVSGIEEQSIREAIRSALA